MSHSGTDRPEDRGPRSFGGGEPPDFTSLARGTRLAGRYVIDQVIAAGGFGITYLCRHEMLGKICAIKEHFPRQFAYRDGATSQVRATDPQTYSWALDRFLQEARALAACKHPGVVDVNDVFEANGTAYMVLAYEDGLSFKDWLDRLGRRPTQAEFDKLLERLLDALGSVHDQGLLHRDIAPDNIMIRRDGTPVLIDFGAARQAFAQRSALMSAIVKTGFSPPEQYTTEGRVQGTWSDIYALAATLYKALTGRTPQEATGRQLGDDLKPVAIAMGDANGYRPRFLAAIDHALRLKPAERPQDVVSWRAQLFNPDTSALATEWAPAQPEPASAKPATFSQIPPPRPVSAPAPAAAALSVPGAPTAGRLRGINGAIAAALALVIVGVAMMSLASRSTGDREQAAVAEAHRNIAAARSLAEIDALERRHPALRSEIEIRRAGLAAEEAARRADEQKRADDQARSQEEQRRIEEARQAEARRVIADAERTATEARRREAEARTLALARQEAETRRAEEVRRAEQRRAAEADGEAQQRVAAHVDEQRQREEARREADRKAAEAERVAALSTLSPGAQEPGLPSTPQPIDPVALTREIQRELARVGCDPGKLDGVWGAGVKRAMEQFAKLSRTTVTTDVPTQASLAAVTAVRARVCTLACDDDEHEVAGKCVPKAKPVVAKVAPPSPPAKSESAKPAPQPQKPEKAEKPDKPAPSTASNSDSGSSRGGTCQKWNPAGRECTDRRGRTCAWRWNQGWICS